MIYAVGITAADTPIVLAGSRKRENAIRKALYALAHCPTLTAHGVLVHEADGRSDAEDVARIRIWAEAQAGQPQPWIEDCVLEALKEIKKEGE